MLTGDEKNLAKACLRQVPCLDDNLMHTQSDAENWVVPGEAAIPAVIDAFVGKVKRREETHRPSEILHGERASRRTTSDFLRAKLSRVSTNDINNNFVRAPSIRKRRRNTANVYKNKRRHPEHPDAAVASAIVVL